MHAALLVRVFDCFVQIRALLGYYCGEWLGWILLQLCACMCVFVYTVVCVQQIQTDILGGGRGSLTPPPN